MPWQSAPVTLTKKQQNELKRIAASDSADAREKMRALIILLISEGLKNKEVAKRLGIHENTVVKWRGRWAGDNQESKIEDYGELTGRPRNVLLPDKLAAINKKSKSKPPKGKPRWTVRTLAEEFDMPVATMQRALIELEINLVSGSQV